MERLVELFREAKRRRVFRVAAVYLAVSWTVIEFSTFLASRLELPSWTGNLVLTLVIVGFPIAIVLAWAFEVTSEGVLRDSASRSEGGRPGGSRPGGGPRRGESSGRAGGGARAPAGSPAARTEGEASPTPDRTESAPEDRDTFDGETVHFSTPSEEKGTFQLLPGRLEILEGADRGEDIYFETPSSGPPEFTFGRRESEDPTHIQLKGRTVSREHAVMHWQEGEWEIENRSSTNPLRVNGERLAEVGATTTLGDGDTVEMGKLTFRFHED